MSNSKTSVSESINENSLIYILTLFCFLSGSSLQPTSTIEVSSDGTFDLNRKFRANFVEEDDFDEVWDSFGEER